MKFNNLINTFAAGEWSPKARYRTDVQQYAQASENLKNFIPQIHGGAFRRPGTRRIVLASDQQTDLQNAFSASVPFSVRSKMIPYVTSGGSKYLIFAFNTAPSTTWFYLNVAGASVDGGGSTLPSVSSAADFTVSAASIKYTQAGDFLFLVDGAGDEPPRVYSATTGLKTIDNDYITIQPWETVPFLPIQANGSSVNLTPAAASGSGVNLTASSAFFDAGHVGAYFKLSSGGTTGVCRVTSVTNSTTAVVTILENVAATAHGTAAGTSWEESAWSDYRGWPKTVTAHQGRVIYGGSDSFPDTLWGSAAGNVFLMMERPFEQDDAFDTYTDDNSRAFTLTPNSKEASNIRALSSDKTLLIHTDRSEIVGYGSQGILGPNDFTFESSSSFGANTPMPVRLNGYSLFVQKGGRKIRDVLFNFDQEQYKSNDLTFLADHLTLDQEYNSGDTTGGTGGQYIDPIVEMCGSVGENAVLWAKTQNGRLLTLVLDRDYGVNAWAPMELGGAGFQRTYPLVKSICAVEGDTGEGDRVFFIVLRRINGSNVVMLEELFIPNESDTLGVTGTLLKTGPHVDSYKTGSTANGTTWTGFTEYVGETLSVMADGFYIGEKTVNGSGQIITTDVYTALSAGYRTDNISQIKTMPMQLGNQTVGSPAGLTKRVDELQIAFYKSYGAKYGHKVDSMYQIDFKDPTANMDDPPEMFTGLKIMRLPTDYTRECQVIIQPQGPWPCNVLAIIARGATYG